MCTFVSQNGNNSAALRKDIVETTMSTPRQSSSLNSFQTQPLTNRNRQANSRKGFGPRYDGAFLPGAFTRNIEAAEPSRGCPTPSDTNCF